MEKINTYALAIHGGAGTILKEKMTSIMEKRYQQALSEALEAGSLILRTGGSALDAVEKAVTTMEDNPLFNAGKGAVFSHTGKHEMEASIMCGKRLQTGAVAAVKNIRNPIQLSRKIMEESPFAYLVGQGAEEFASSQKLRFEEDDYFFTQLRYDQWQATKTGDSAILDHDAEKKFGTVGAVALDTKGDLAAATSTGGLTNKKYGRIGDSSVIGSGTYANNHTCAISCTGYGEFFLRAVVAYDISCLMEYKGLSLKEASDFVVQEKLRAMNGEGGIIGVDSKGNIVLNFNSEGMYRGYINSEDHAIVTRIFKE